MVTSRSHSAAGKAAHPPQSTGGEQGKQQGKQTHAIDQHQRTALLQQGHVLMGAQQPAGFVAGNFTRQQAQYPRQIVCVILIVRQFFVCSIVGAMRSTTL
jgi:hypothetical protein